jgi:hypothetical protein
MRTLPTKASRINFESKQDLPSSSAFHFSSFIFLQTSLVCPVFGSITVVTGRRLQGYCVGIFLLDYYAVFDDFGSSWWQLATYWRRGSPSPAASWLRNRPEAGKTPAKLSSCPLFALSRARLSMAIWVTRPPTLTLQLLAAAFPEPRGDIQLNPEGNRINGAVRTVAVAGAQIHRAREIVIESEVDPVVPGQAHAPFG